ncbi:MAG: HlyD family efflux transporter periplasmic adaptor subunit [Gemmataceae bacterium]|nr:HlyD family efflux transporter periplasmic adaptor subunit [Gemmataceae bacterium]
MSAPASSPVFRLIGQIPTLLVLVALGGVGYWGMKNEWKLPDTTAKGESKDQSWCSAHNVPEDVCVECRPYLLSRGEPFGYCRIHAVHECPWCHPEVAQLDSPYKVSAADLESAKAALAFSARAQNGRNDKLHERRIQFASLEAFDRSGVEIYPAFKGKIAETASVHGEITHDPGRVAHVSSRAPGSVFRVFKHLGDIVHEGELLALVETAVVGQAKVEYQQWLAHLDVRVKTRNKMDVAVVPAPTVLAADTAIREARIKLASSRQALINLGLHLPTDDFKGLSDDEVAERLHFLGIPEEYLRGFNSRTTSNNLLPIRSQIGGTVTSRDIVAGEVVDPMKMLFEVVDNSVVWLTIGVRNEDVSKVRLNQTKIVFEPDGQTKPVEGVVAWISTEADHKTRTVRVRVNLDNKDAKLRANTFGHGHVILREDENVVLVPNQAVHVEGGNNYIFVRDRRFREEGYPKVFHTRTARVGAKDDRYTEIIAGVLPGELVATKNSTLIMAELLRGKIGEG